MAIQIEVNGRRHSVDVDPAQPLLSVLRNELALTGTKYGCGEGRCGACTVLLGDTPVHACVTPVSSAAGKPITTIEGDSSATAACTRSSRRSSTRARSSAATVRQG
jgi:aerobic-type carbon monoxide dehydrogenase small subunit (CoxS/CutS family)